MPTQRRPRSPRFRTRSRSDTFKPVTPDEVSDLALLPKRFEHHRGEMRSLLEMLTTRFTLFAERVEGKLDDVLDRMKNTEQRVEAIEAEHRTRHPNGAE